MPLFISLAVDLVGMGGDSIPFLTRVQEAHRGDFWANFYLAKDLIRAQKDQDSLRFAQAAVAIRPDFSLGL